MPTTYKGLTIPLHSDLADGADAFQDYTDTLPYQVFADTAGRDAWTTVPNGSLCVTADTGALWKRKAGVWVPVQPLEGSFTGDQPNISTGGPIVLGTYAGVANPYPVKVTVNAVVEFGFGQGAFATITADIVRTDTGAAFTSQQGRAEAGLWKCIPLNYSWDVAANASSGFQVRGVGVNFNGFNCYYKCNVTYRVQAA